MKIRNIFKDQSNILFPVLAIIFSSLFVWGTFLYARQEQRISLPPGAIEKIDPKIASPVTREEIEANVTTYSLSDITTTPEELIQEKTNSNRKIITPKTAEEVETIRQIVEQNGGELISANESTVVVEMTPEEENVIADQLDQENVGQKIEIDHPIYVLAETDLWNLAKVGAPQAWEKTRGSGVRVGVIDTGVDYNHPEFAGRFAGGYDNVNEDSDPFDGHGHGTHVAGIIASGIDNAGVAGVAPEATFYAYKAIADNGVGYTSDLVESIDTAINDGMQVINISIGTDQPSSALETVLSKAVREGLVVVAAAGNTGGGAVMYPAAYDSVISVAASDQNDQLASFSSLGGEITAPGVDIISTLPGGGYGTLSGTSMAAPHVTATSALLVANGVTNVRQTLYDSSLDVGSEGPDGLFGYGIVQAGESVNPTEPTPTPEPASPTPSPDSDSLLDSLIEEVLDSTQSADQEDATNSARDRNFESTASTRPVIRRRTVTDPDWFERIRNRNVSEERSEQPSEDEEETSEDDQSTTDEVRDSRSFFGNENANFFDSTSSGINLEDGESVRRTVRSIFNAFSEVVRNRVINEVRQTESQQEEEQNDTSSDQDSDRDSDRDEDREREEERSSDSRREETRSTDSRSEQRRPETTSRSRGSVRGAHTSVYTQFENTVFDLVWDFVRVMQ